MPLHFLYLMHCITFGNMFGHSLLRVPCMQPGQKAVSAMITLPSHTGHCQQTANSTPAAGYQLQ